MTKIELMDGKYTVIHDNGFGLRALRYGEEWRNLGGDNLILAMAQEIEELREQLEAHILVIRQLDALTDMVYFDLAPDGPLIAEEVANEIRQVIAELEKKVGDIT